MVKMVERTCEGGANRAGNGRPAITGKEKEKEA